MKLRTLLIFTSLLTLQSCDFYQMYREKDNLEYLSKEMDADECKISSVNEKNNLSGDTIVFSFIELNLINSKSYKNPNVDKASLTSYCAIKAYEMFNPEIWKGKDGINIVFDGKEEFLTNKKHYYKLKELQDITKAINTSNEFLSTLEKIDNRIKNLDFISRQNNIDTLEAKDSLATARYFSKKLFVENNDLVTAIYRVYNKITGIENSVKKYYYEKVVITDTVDSKITKTDYYRVNASLVLPDNEVHYIKYYFKADNLNKIEAIEM